LDAEESPGAVRDPRDLLLRPGGVGRGVDADHPPGTAARLLQRPEPGDHARLGGAGDRAHDHGVEEDARRPLLLGDLVCPPGEAEPAEGVVGGTGGDGVRLAARLLDLAQGLLPALLEADPEPGPHHPYVAPAAPADVA